jgi:hypothetical protein
VLLLCAAFYNHGTLAHAAAAACRIHLVQLWSGMPGGGRLTRFMSTSLHPCTTSPSAHRTSIRCARTPHAHTARHGATQRCKGLNSRRAWHFTTMQHSGSRCSVSVQNQREIICLFVCLCGFARFGFAATKPRAACGKLGKSIVRRERECARC